MWRAVVFGMLLWSLIVVMFVEHFHVLVSDDPYDPGANMAAQWGAVLVLVVWLIGMLVGLGVLVLALRRTNVPHR